ncbi:hypothetical protein [Streptomyces sp. NPDC003719]
MRTEAGAVICPQQPLDFEVVGLWYDDFGQVSDEEVIKILDEHNAPTHHSRCRDQ